MLAPKTKQQADELRREIMTQPAGFLAKLYVDLYEAQDLRIERAKREAKDWYGGLP